jgi:hypothetical protein
MAEGPAASIPAPRAGDGEASFRQTKAGSKLPHSKGAPAKSFSTSTKVSEKFDDPHPAPFRCASCGYLESYARDEFAAR